MNSRGLIRLQIASAHALIRSGLRLILDGGPRMRVTAESASGGDVLHSLQKTNWDVLLMDLMFPDCDGLELLREIRRKDQRRPILVLSVLAEDSRGVRALRAGADGYLGTETLPGRLMEAISLLARGQKVISPALASKVARKLTDRDESLAHEKLSDREFQVLCKIAAGSSTKEIGRILGVSPKTVSTYRSRVLSKMGLNTNAALVRYATEQKLIP